MLAIGVLLAWAQPVAADGIIIPEPPPWPEPPPLRDTWLTIRYHRVEVTIEDQVATTHVDQVFLNEHDWEVEGTYIFPLPAGAAISDFVMWVDGKRIEGQILEADEARQIYEDIVRRRRDPALLEYVGQRRRSRPASSPSRPAARAAHRDRVHARCCRSRTGWCATSTR